MNKAILMSIQPQWVCKILNGEKTIDVRKKFPKDYVGWVYIYCTKGKLPIMEYINRGVRSIITDNKFDKNFKYYLNGKVVARFWCDKVEEIKVYDIFGVNAYRTEEMCVLDLVSKSRLTQADFERYLGNKNGYAIHISKLEVFDKPKELKELKKVGYNELYNKFMDNCLTDRNSYENLEDSYSLTKAPESWYYIEGE